MCVQNMQVGRVYSEVQIQMAYPGIPQSEKQKEFIVIWTRKQKGTEVAFWIHNLARETVCSVPHRTRDSSKTLNKILGSQQRDRLLLEGPFQNVLPISSNPLNLKKNPVDLFFIQIPSPDLQASCVEFPWMCLEPFDCLNSTGKVESFEELSHQLAKPSGANLQGWCYAGPELYKFAAYCVNKDNVRTDR